MLDNHSESSPELKLHIPELKGMDWGNDELFFTYSFVDESSQFDPKAKWNFGCECYERTYYCRVPKAFQNCWEMIDEFVELMRSNYPTIEGFWTDAETSSL